MKKLHLLALVIALCATAQAQWTTVTASHIYGGASAVQSGNNLLSAGTITFQGTDNTGKLIGYQVGGIGQQVNWPFICQITTGAIAANCKVPDTTQTNPVDICLSITIKNSNGQVLVGGSPNSGYQCAQPFGATWNFDTFIPYAAGWPLASFRIATIGTAGIAQAPNCLSQGSGYYPQSLDSSGNWICTPVSVTAGVQSFNGRTGPVTLIGTDIPNNAANTSGNAGLAPSMSMARRWCQRKALNWQRHRRIRQQRRLQSRR